MAHPLELKHEIEVYAPEEVWDAIATGPGMDSWFMGRNEEWRVTLVADEQPDLDHKVSEVWSVHPTGLCQVLSEEYESMGGLPAPFKGHEYF